MKVVCIHDYKGIPEHAPKYLELLEATVVKTGGRPRYKLEDRPGLWWQDRYEILADPPEETIVTKGE